MCTPVLYILRRASCPTFRDLCQAGLMSLGEITIWQTRADSSEINWPILSSVTSATYKIIITNFMICGVMRTLLFISTANRKK